MRDATNKAWAAQDFERDVQRCHVNGSLKRAKAGRVRSILAERRRRDEFFGKLLFTDPAWDILLELFWGELVEHRFSTNELCVRSGVPMTTALRWITRLTYEGWLTRTHDPQDGRRVFVALSPQAVETMERYFDELGTPAAVI